MSLIQDLKNKILDGGQISEAEGYALVDLAPCEELLDAAAEISARMVSRDFDSCSIINARSGRCPENCKWCAQSAHYKTDCKEYPLVDERVCMNLAEYNRMKGVKRFSMVTSGKAMRGETLDKVCDMLRRVGETGISTCASLGLLDREGLEKLYATGTHRYHCNLETAPSMFSKLCTTHTIEDKLRTIAMAHEIGFEVCSGGIIGMGENRRQRMEFALTLRKAAPASIPINILSPIKGTPLEDTPLISEDEIIDAVALFRFVHPAAVLRFAGGRARLSDDAQLKAMRVGITGGIVGDLLTTVVSTIDADRELVERAGLNF